jgi:hypothetical protein
MPCSRTGAHPERSTSTDDRPLNSLSAEVVSITERRWDLPVSLIGIDQFAGRSVILAFVAACSHVDHPRDELFEGTSRQKVCRHRRRTLLV